jgi:hypothetical protein
MNQQLQQLGNYDHFSQLGSIYALELAAVRRSASPRVKTALANLVWWYLVNQTSMVNFW